MDIRVTRARKIHGDGRHNAFTGIEEAFGRTFVAFRSASTHMAPDGSIRILSSADREVWKTVANVREPGADLRDPKLVEHGGSLKAYFARQAPKTPRKMMMAESVNGREFSEPMPVRGIPEGHWLWHVREHGGVLRGAAYRREGGMHIAALHASEDGLNWTLVQEFPVPGNETYLDFDAEGTLWALLRDDLFGCVPTLCRAEPPYRHCDWVRRLPMRLQGPMLKRLEGGCVIIARQWDEPGWLHPRTDLFWLADGKDPERVCTLPSGGDTSYAGWLDVAPGRAVVSYYSSHEHAMDLAHGDESVFGRDPEEGAFPKAADIYLADVSYEA